MLVSPRPISGNHHGKAVGADHTERNDSGANDDSGIEAVGLFPDIQGQRGGDSKLRNHVEQQVHVEMGKVPGVEWFIQPKDDLVDHEQRCHANQADDGANQYGGSHSPAVFLLRELEAVACQLKQGKIGQQYDDIPWHGGEPFPAEWADAKRPDM